MGTAATPHSGGPESSPSEARMHSRQPRFLSSRQCAMTSAWSCLRPAAGFHFGDWVLKLIDAYPGNAPDPRPNPRNIRMGDYQMLLAGDLLRGKFRRSFSRPEPLQPNRISRLEFTLGDKLHRFGKGHRIMVHVQSSWFPLFDRNPQRFCDICHAKPSDYRKARVRVYRSSNRPSFITLPVR